MDHTVIWNLFLDAKMPSAALHGGIVLERTG